MKWINRLYIFFLGAILAITTGFGLAAFYPQPVAPQYPDTAYSQPVPIDISVSMNIYAAYQTDVEQIISNFVPYFEPYLTIETAVPLPVTNGKLQQQRTPNNFAVSKRKINFGQSRKNCKRDRYAAL